MDAQLKNVYKDTFQILTIDKLRDSKTNPRKHFDQEKFTELKDSIKSKGILVPLLVRSVNGYYEIVAGSRRFKAAKEAGLKEIPAIVKQLTDEEVMETQIIENLQREDVYALDEAEGFQYLMNSGKYDVKLLSEKLGKSEKYVYTRLRLNRLIDPLKELYDSGFLQLGHILLAARHPKTTQEKIAMYLLSEDGYGSGWEYLKIKLGRIDEQAKGRSAPSIADLNNWLKDNAEYDLSLVKFDLSDKILYPEAGDCLSCKKNTSNDLGLFDGYKKNICTDRVCRVKKTELFLKQKFEAIKKKDPKAVCISTGYRTFTPKDWTGKIYNNNEYSSKTPKKDECKDTVPALIIEDQDYGNGKKEGTATFICLNRKCKKHNQSYSYSSGSSSPKESKAEKERKLIAKRVQELKAVEIARQIKAKVKKFDVEILRRIVAEEFVVVYLTEPGVEAFILGVDEEEYKVMSHPQKSKLIDAKFKSFTETELAQVYMICQVGYGGDEKILKSLKIDGKAIEKKLKKEVEKELKEAKKLVAAKVPNKTGKKK